MRYEDRFCIYCIEFFSESKKNEKLYKKFSLDDFTSESIFFFNSHSLLFRQWWRLMKSVFIKLLNYIYWKIIKWHFFLCIHSTSPGTVMRKHCFYHPPPTYFMTSDEVLNFSIYYSYAFLVCKKKYTLISKPDLFVAF